MRDHQENVQSNKQKKNMPELLESDSPPYTSLWTWDWDFRKNSMICRVQAKKMRFLSHVAGYRPTLRDRWRNAEIRDELRIMRILNRIAQYQLKWLEHLNRMWLPHRQTTTVLQAERTGGTSEGFEWPPLVYLLGNETNYCWYNPCLKRWRFMECGKWINCNLLTVKHNVWVKSRVY